MRFYNAQHKYYCGIDLHAKTMYLCIQDKKGKVLLHRNIRSRPDHFLKAIKPYKKDLAVAVECMFCWYWIADLCVINKITFVLGHALYMRAIHGGKAKNDRIDSLKIATLLRGGTLPMAYVYPPGMRGTRDLMRRRMYMVNKRSELITHIRNTNSQYNLPDITERLDRKSDRNELLERFPDPGVQKSIEADLLLLDQYNKVIPQVEWHIEKTAKCHCPKTFHLLKTIDGIGPVLSLTIMYEIHTIERFPSVGNFISYCRLVKCSRESGGKSQGTGGSKIGNVHLKWAFHEAAVLFIRGENEKKKYYNKLENKHGTAKALTIIAAKLGRAVYFMLKRNTVFDLNKFLKI